MFVEIKFFAREQYTYFVGTNLHESIRLGQGCLWKYIRKELGVVKAWHKRIKRIFFYYLWSSMMRQFSHCYWQVTIWTWVRGVHPDLPWLTQGGTAVQSVEVCHERSWYWLLPGSLLTCTLVPQWTFDYLFVNESIYTCAADLSKTLYNTWTVFSQAISWMLK